MTDDVHVLKIKAAVTRRREWDAAYKAALEHRIDEIFKVLADKIANDTELMRGKTVEYAIRKNMFDIDVLDHPVRVPYDAVLEPVAIKLAELEVVVSYDTSNPAQDYLRDIGISIFIMGG